MPGWIEPGKVIIAVSWKSQHDGKFPPQHARQEAFECGDGLAGRLPGSPLRVMTSPLRGAVTRRLTEDVGHPKVREHLASVVTIMKPSDEHDDFASKLDRIHPGYDRTLSLLLQDARASRWNEAANQGAEPDMDDEERKRLEDEINHGVRNVGIYKVDGDALEKENRSALVKGGAVGFSIGGAAGVAYMQNTSWFNTSPLGLFIDDYVLVALLIVAVGTFAGAGLAWMVKEGSFGKSPKDTP